MKNLSKSWRFLAEQWPALTFYQRFESVIALALTLVIAVVILIALYRLIAEVVSGLIFGALNPLEHKVFQRVFGEIMTLLIALEFNHTLQYVVTREQSVIQIKLVLLVALLSLARKFIKNLKFLSHENGTSHGSKEFRFQFREPSKSVSVNFKEDLIMKALVYHGPGKRAWEEKPNPPQRTRSESHSGE